MRNQNLLTPLFAITAVILLGAGCSRAGTVPVPATEPAAKSGIETGGGLQEAAMVRIGPEGFTPAVIGVKRGEYVTWINEDPGGPHRVASNPDPSHADYPGFDSVDPIAPGQSWGFKFDKIGAWGYSDRLHPSVTGEVRVTE
jgi:plastocyanin